MEIKTLLEKFIGGYDELKNYLADVPEEAMKFKPAPDKWSIHEIVVHLADAEANAFVRGKKIIAENGSAISEYDQDAWADSMHYHDLDYQEALELFRLLRQNMYHVLMKLPLETWHNHIIHPESGRINLMDWIELYIDHVEIHLQQMNRNLYDWNKKISNGQAITG